MHLLQSVCALMSCFVARAEAQCTAPAILLDGRYEHVARDFLLNYGSLAMVGDLDHRDGPDVVFAPLLFGWGEIEVFLNTGRGQCVRSAYTGPADQLCEGATLGDIDHDGDLDIIVLRRGPTPPLFFMNDGQGRFTVEPLGSRIGDLLLAKSACCVDLDGDGWNDLFVGMQGAGQCRVYLNDRRGRFVDATFTHLPWAVQGCTHNIVATDVDGDSDQDLVVAMGGLCGVKQENVVLINDGRAHLTPLPLAGIRRWSVSIAVGDVNGDGRPDLFFGAIQDPPELWLNGGGGTFVDGSALLPPAASNTHAAAVVDIDGDGWDDLVAGVLRPAGYSVEAYMNRNGQGFVLDTTAIQMPPSGLQAYFLHGTDMDQDGDADLVVGGRSFPNTTTGLKILVHSRRHILPAGAPTLGQPWTIALYAKPGQIVFPALAAGMAHVPLGSLGTLGLDPATSFAFQPVTMSGCRQTIQVAVPNMPILRGRSLAWQACVVDLVQPSETRLTNWTIDMVQ